MSRKPYCHYINGEWTVGDGRDTFASDNPATGDELAEFHRGTPTDVQAAVDAAERAADEWRELSYTDHAAYLWDVYQQLRDRKEELGEIVTMECGKEISEGLADIEEAAHMVEWAAGNARHPHGDVVPSEIAGKLGDVPGRECCLEMGGKNALVITEEADLDIALHCAVMSFFKTTGQRCVSSERLIAHEDVYDEFTDRFVDLVRQVSVGDPLDEDTFMGPLVDEEQVDKFHSYNELAVEEGVDVLVDRAELGAEEIPDGHEDGHWAGPFVYETDYDPDLRCIHEEVFGPHVALIEYSGDIEDAMEIHNSVEYGLAGAIVSEDYRQINHYRDRAEVGLAYANLPCIGAEVQLPFGGVGKSGKGAPHAREVIEAVTDRVAWTVNNSKEIELAQGLSAEIQTDDDRS